MEECNDKNLICYFGWGRLEYVKLTLPAVIKSMRPQDRLLVVDQEMHNFEYLATLKDKIDYLIFLKNNYKMGPMWDLFRGIAIWLRDKSKTELAWQPDFINIIESDGLGEDDWINKLMPLFNLKDEKIAVVSGYLGEDDPNTVIVKRIGDAYIKGGTQGVNVIVRTEDFIDIYEYPRTQDFYFQEKVKAKGGFACLPLVKHIGEKGRKNVGFFK